MGQLHWFTLIDLKFYFLMDMCLFFLSEQHFELVYFLCDVIEILFAVVQILGIVEFNIGIDKTFVTHTSYLSIIQLRCFRKFALTFIQV